jgi:hypothetical protein
VIVNNNFILKNDLRVLSNLVIGDNTGTETPIEGGIVSYGNVGIGTNIVTPGNVLTVLGGNISLDSTGSQSGYGIVFSDGSFQNAGINIATIRAFAAAQG